MAETVAISRRERNKLRTRARILDAASKLFTKHGVEGTTIDELAEAADISRATFFNYFDSKPAVVKELLAEIDRGFFAYLQSLLERDVPVRELLEIFFTNSAKGIQASAPFFRVMIAEAEKSFPDPLERDRYRNMTKEFRKIVEKGIARREARTDVPSDLLAEIMVGAYVSVLRIWRVDPAYNLPGRLRNTARVLADMIARPASVAAGPGGIKGPAVVIEKERSTQVRTQKPPKTRT
ncbi:MAG TPA: TetR/AcrR family transcriptional regulator [Alphaproteobacteria bacterium]|nr:TetR/AcrR family transcriptional regulator [Alphaproteobacteria bacterium]